MKKDESGNNYLPILMVDTTGFNPARAQWAFCHAVHPGKVFDMNDELVIGNMAMLDAAENEGLTYETGWIDEGVWNYFESFFAHASLWLGQPQKAVDAMYAMANHASPTLVWREEQTIQGASKYNECGDMPHNWASAEFIRMIRNFLVLEPGNELHLLEALPKEWTKVGMKTELSGIYIFFCIISLSLAVNTQRTEADLTVDLKSKGHTNPEKVIGHNELWSGGKEMFELDPVFPVNRKISIE